MKAVRIFFDMDGVLADFDRGVEELLGIEPVPQTSRDEARIDALWEAVRNCPHYYDRLELMPGAKELFDAVYEARPDGTEILTGLPKPYRGITTAAEDKIAWTRRLISETVPIHTVIREDKIMFCRGPECVLIDDLSSNIADWEAHGGTGILYRSADETLTQLRQLGILQPDSSR